MNPSPTKGRALTGRDKYPCRNFPNGICPKRRPGCQDKRPDFLAAKAANDARKEQERAKRQAINEVNEFRIASAAKGSRKKMAER